jgi:hypothetical protein
MSKNIAQVTICLAGQTLKNLKKILLNALDVQKIFKDYAIMIVFAASRKLTFFLEHFDK